MLAMVGQSTLMLNDKPLSSERRPQQAGSYKGFAVYSWITSAPLGMSNLNLDAGIGSLAFTPVNRILVR